MVKINEKKYLDAGAKLGEDVDHGVREEQDEGRAEAHHPGRPELDAELLLGGGKIVKVLGDLVLVLVIFLL